MFTTYYNNKAATYFVSPLTLCTWRIVSSEDGYVATCEALFLATEGKDFGNTLEMIDESERLLLEDLKYDDMLIEQYIQKLRKEHTTVTLGKP